MIPFGITFVQMKVSSSADVIAGKYSIYLNLVLTLCFLILDLRLSRFIIWKSAWEEYFRDLSTVFSKFSKFSPATIGKPCHLIYLSLTSTQHSYSWHQYSHVWPKVLECVYALGWQILPCHIEVEGHWMCASAYRAANSVRICPWDCCCLMFFI